MPPPPVRSVPPPNEDDDFGTKAAEPPGPAEPIRSLADELRDRPVDDLVALLRARPDLTVPLPTTLTELATRATTRASVRRTLDSLDTRALQVLDVLCALPEPTSPDQVNRHWGAPADEALSQLRALGLIWGPPDGIRTVRTVRDLLGPYPAGLGPPLAEALARRSSDRLLQLAEDLGLVPDTPPVSGSGTVSSRSSGSALDRLLAHLTDPENVRTVLDTAPNGVRPVLDQLIWGPPVGHVPDADRPVRRQRASGPVEWLLAHGLLAVADSAHVVLPREIALALRGGRVHRVPATDPAPLRVEHRAATLVTGTAAGAAYEAVRLVEALTERLGRHPVPVLRNGGLGVRELRRLATELDVPEPIAALTVEIGYVTGLLADDGEVEPSWAPTPAFDRWRSLDVPQRWVSLAQAWLGTTRCPHLVGTRDEKNSVRQALSPGLDRMESPELRRRALLALAGAGGESGVEVSAPAGQIACATAAELTELLNWWQPRGAGATRADLVARILTESAWLGVTGAGGLAPAVRPLLEEPPDPDRAASLLAEALPTPVDHILVQADLTAIAPGPCTPGMARELNLLAEVDSRGAATVFRFTPDSIRRALDSGHTADDLVELLRRRARGELPQPLRYLITDTARGYGRIRIGTAGCYLRSDDESALLMVLSDRRSTRLGLRRLAPTVLAARSSPETVLATLRDMGLAPAAEGAHGDLVLDRPHEHRTPPRSRPRPVSPLPPPPSAELLHGVVDALLRADQSVRNSRDRISTAARTVPEPASTASPAAPDQVLALLRDAAARHEPVWIGYADPTGRTVPRLVRPLHVEGGRVDVQDRETDRIRTLSVHRIASVTPEAE